MTTLVWCAVFGFYSQMRLKKKKKTFYSYSVQVVDEQEQPCGNPNQNILLVIVVASAAVLFGVFIALLLWIVPKVRVSVLKTHFSHSGRCYLLNCGKCKGKCKFL